ncbi:unnamed protein product [Didymodactylos carnosus]|nr:unnamed protein product [Didymodactylos carnosus]CAF4214692.1 unnamed protein product [Didymodactylos carnosus]
MNEKCICMLGRFDRECHLQYDPCKHIMCQNQGICIPLDIRASPFMYACICNQEYFDNLCQYSSAKAFSTVTKSIQNQLHMTSFSQIPLVTVYFVDISNNIAIPAIRDHFVYTKISFGSDIIAISNRQMYLSSFIFVQIYFNTKDLYGHYYLIGLLKLPMKLIKTSTLTSHRYPHIGELLNSTIMSYVYLKRIKFY